LVFVGQRQKNGVKAREGGKQCKKLSGREQTTSAALAGEQEED
jgi:hypothetical protein